MARLVELVLTPRSKPWDLASEPVDLAEKPTRVRRTRCAPWARLATLLIVSGTAVAACRGGEPETSDTYPAGTHVLVDRERAAPFIKAVSTGRARLNRIAARVAALPPCVALYGSTVHGGLAEAIEGLSCDGSPPASMVDSLKRADADVAVVLSGSAPRTIALGRFDDDGGLTVDVTPTAEGFPAWLTSDSPPSRAVLDETDALVAARWKAPSVKLDVSGGEFASLGDLSSTLASALLDGGWEFFVYRTNDDPSILPVIALSTRSEGAAKAALDEVAEKLAITYRLGRSSLALGTDDEAICLSAIAALPGLSPCALVRDSFVVIGWNAEALMRGLRRAPASPPATSFLRADFSRIDPFDKELVERDQTASRGRSFESSVIRDLSVTSIASTQGSIVRLRLSIDEGTAQ